MKVFSLHWFSAALQTESGWYGEQTLDTSEWFTCDRVSSKHAHTKNCWFPAVQWEKLQISRGFQSRGDASLGTLLPYRVGTVGHEGSKHGWSHWLRQLSTICSGELGPFIVSQTMLLFTFSIPPQPPPHDKNHITLTTVHMCALKRQNARFSRLGPQASTHFTGPWKQHLSCISAHHSTRRKADENCLCAESKQADVGRITGEVTCLWSRLIGEVEEEVCSAARDIAGGDWQFAWSTWCRTGEVNRSLHALCSVIVHSRMTKGAGST